MLNHFVRYRNYLGSLLLMFGLQKFHLLLKIWFCSIALCPNRSHEGLQLMVFFVVLK